MAPTTAGAGPASTPAGTSADPSEWSLMPLVHRDNFPSPRELTAGLAERFEAALAELRSGRTVTRPEDTHNVIRQVNTYRVRAEEYAAAFMSLSRRATEALEEELIEAVGEQKPGEPVEGMVVPDGAYEINLKPEYATERDIDMSQVLIVLAQVVADEWTTNGEPVTEENALSFAVEVAQRALELHHKADPSIKAVRALAKLAGARGDDDLAAVVNSSISKTRRTYRRTRVTFTAK